MQIFWQKNQYIFTFAFFVCRTTLVPVRTLIPTLPHLRHPILLCIYQPYLADPVLSPHLSHPIFRCIYQPYLADPTYTQKRPSFESLLSYPEPGSNRHGLLHWCLRPARLPIPPSGLLSRAGRTTRGGERGIRTPGTVTRTTV